MPPANHVAEERVNCFGFINYSPGYAAICDSNEAGPTTFNSYPSSLGRGLRLGFRPLHSSPSQPSLIRLTQMHSTCHKREGVISISYKYKARTILTDQRKTSASEHQAMAN